MVWLGMVGIVALVLAILHFVNPRAILNMDEVGKHVVISMEEMVKKHPKILGAFYLLGAVLLIYVGFFLKAR